ncbi:S-4TM family putative pore-forming effector [Bacteroides cellulosilyticus]|uniref:S-4TM family putative pore-forming effector n=1 Tax=Bacteroides cellulosilyticus TaxID=246787 RepID=UPI0022E64BDF|nr:S-4TM family putative pore-forming effector [Bacteroides cellulosilyticus]
MNKGQEILYKQNLDINIDRLLAQRRLYSNAKIMQYILIAITVIIPVLIAFITNFSNLRIDDTSWIYTIYAIVVIFGEKILEIFIDRNKKTAASIQEKFDTNIFDIPENELLNSVFIDHDIVRKYSKKDKLNANKISRVTNWYSTRIDCLQTNIAILFCQRMNICYDQNIKKKYNKLLISLSVLTFITLLIISLTNDFSLKKFIIEVILPSIPILNFTYKEINQNIESVDNLQKLREIIENKLSSLSRNDVIEIEELRNIQDRIFNNRILSPLIPDFIYKILWTELEDEMNYSVENRIVELQS